MSSYCHSCFKQKNSIVCPHCGYDEAADPKKYPYVLKPDTILNAKYLVGRVLGKGGFGVIYAALDLEKHKVIAIKEYFPDKLAVRLEDMHTVSPVSESKAQRYLEGMDNFREEATTLAAFTKDPNIVRVYEYFLQNGTGYYTMEYVTGVSFREYLKEKGGKISLPEFKRIAVPILDAMTDIHAQGYIHRDITPDNIYVNADGVTKLIDFGAAKKSGVSRPGLKDVVLKHFYSPIEQYSDHFIQGPAADIYSFAATAYSALTGKIPPESIDRVEKDELIPIKDLCPDLLQEAAAAIEKGLSVQPEDRWQSAIDFKNALFSKKPVVRQEEKTDQEDIAGKNDSGKKTGMILGGCLAAAILIFLVFGSMLSGMKRGISNRLRSSIETESSGTNKMSAAETVAESVSVSETAVEEETGAEEEAAGQQTNALEKYVEPENSFYGAQEELWRRSNHANDGQYDSFTDAAGTWWYAQNTAESGITGYRVDLEDIESELWYESSIEGRALHVNENGIIYIDPAGTVKMITRGDDGGSFDTDLISVEDHKGENLFVTDRYFYEVLSGEGAESFEADDGETDQGYFIAAFPAEDLSSGNILENSLISPYAVTFKDGTLFFAAADGIMAADETNEVSCLLSHEERQNRSYTRPRQMIAADDCIWCADQTSVWNLGYDGMPGSFYKSWDKYTLISMAFTGDKILTTHYDADRGSSWIESTDPVTGNSIRLPCEYFVPTEIYVVSEQYVYVLTGKTEGPSFVLVDVENMSFLGDFR